MNVSCTSCSAKYGIPDEKVRGKKVKITCKHCGTAIVVDGTTLDAPAAAPAAPAAAVPTAKVASPTPVAASPAPKPEASAPASELSFDIAYPDDRQETLKLSEIVAKYASGELGDDAFLWREGMADWKAPRDIAEIAAAISARAPAPKPQNAISYEEDEATKIQVSPMDALADDVGGQWREPAKEAPSHPQAPFDLRAPTASPPVVTSASAKPVAVAAKPEAAKPAAARRSAARGGGDLFGDLAAAGSEEDESLGIDAKEMAPKMTGARNESSVLFSLDSLVKQEQKQAPPKKAASKQDDAAILMGSDSSPNSIANVGTGSFGSAFAAPDFNAPVTVVPEVRAQDPFNAGGAPAKKGGAGVWIGLVAVLVIGGGAAAMFFSGKLAGTPPAPTPTVAATTSKPETPPAPTAEPSAAEVASAAPAPSAAPHVASNTGGAAAATPASTAATSPTAGNAKPGEAATKPGEAATKPTEKPSEAAATKPTAAPAVDSSAPPFDTNAAKAALGAAAGNAGSCKTADGPTGNGKVSVTFMPSGRATNTQVSGDLAGTAVGGCVARLFRSAKVPAFSGDPVTVSKSFAIQ
ncbi:MAG TPA: zinc-ribbon domain-containing protein [Polyangiaceae bacterium]|nr:zinc-ribbon domain-containing protein [Polyangiaceae bacterium]